MKAHKELWLSGLMNSETRWVAYNVTNYWQFEEMVNDRIGSMHELRAEDYIMGSMFFALLFAEDAGVETIEI